jgi:hypothetical protein
MSLLVRLYPAAWRERYGDEMAAILEDRPPGPFDVADMLLGAIDAHLYLRGLGHRSEHRKGIPMSLRLAGGAAVVGGALWTLFFALGAVAVAVDGDLAPAALLFVVAGLTLLVAAAGLSAFQFRDHPRAIWLSFLIPLAGVLLMTVSWLGLPANDSLWNLGILGLFMIVIGAAIFAAVTFQTAALSRPAAAVTLIGAILFIPGMMGLAGNTIIVVVAGIVFGLGWIGLGIDAIRRDRVHLPTTPSTT